MVKVAFSSDNHLDVNRLPVETVLKQQAAWLNQQQVQIYVHLGDLFNDLTKTRNYMEELDQALTGEAYYLLGNHDMLNHAPYELVEHLEDPHYLYHRWIDIPQTNWRIVGNNGWYDYSFSAFADAPQKVAQWKNVYWLDSSISQPLNDLERMKLVCDQVDQDLSRAVADHKRVIFGTHFAPRHELLTPKPKFVDTRRKNYFYQMVNAMMGSDRLGERLESFSNVKMVMYGHLHRSHPPMTQHGVTYYHQAVGVKNKRINEWHYPTFIQQWKRTLRILEL